MKANQAMGHNASSPMQEQVQRVARHVRNTAPAEAFSATFHVALQQKVVSLRRKMHSEDDPAEIQRIQRTIFHIERMMYLLMATDQDMLQFARIQERMWSNSRSA